MINWLRDNLIILDACDSTNAIAAQFATEGCPNGTVVIAHHQTKGRGRMGRVWQCYEGSVALSIVLRPKLSPEQSTRLVFAAGVALVEAAKKVGIRAFIKWPNDILIPSPHPVEKLGPFRKIAGILVEQNLSRDGVNWAILGIGVNLFRPKNNDAILPQTGFISDVYDVSFSRADFVDVLLNQLEDSLLKIENAKGYHQLHSQMKQYSMLLGQQVCVEQDSVTLNGLAKDIALDGSLIVRDREGNDKSIYYGDVGLKLKDA